MKKPRSGYVEPTKKTRGIILPVEVSDAWNQQAVHELSQEWHAAIVLWIAVKRFPHLREAVFRAAKTLHIQEAIQEVEGALIELIERDLLAESAASLTKTEKAQLLARRKETSSR